MSYCKNIMRLELSKVFDNNDEKLQDCNVVYVEIPELQLDEDNKVIVPSLQDTIQEEYIIPHAITEETIESETGYCMDFFENTLKTEDPLAIDLLLPFKDDIKREKELFINKKDKTSPRRHKSRRKQVFPQLPNETPVVTENTVPVLAAAPPDSEAKDLMWLLNFKLDKFLPNNLLDTPAFKAATDEKTNDSGNKINIKDDPSEDQKKPPFTYTELIECALTEKGPLTVSEIYQWISDIFPYYKAWDDRWKNSVRHNLSINPYFRKGGKAKQGAGHLWTVSEVADTARSLKAKRQRYQEFEEYTKRMKSGRSEESMSESKRARIKMEEDAREAEIAINNIIEDKENHTNQIPGQDILQSAGEILNGVKRNVAVEYIEVKTGNDFLNPVSKEVLMGECGFLSQMELSESADFEIVEAENGFECLDDFSFQLCDLNCQTTQIPHLVN